MTQWLAYTLIIEMVCLSGVRNVSDFSYTVLSVHEFAAHGLSNLKLGKLSKMKKKVKYLLFLVKCQMM